MARAARRQRPSISKAKPYHKASQNIGWVIAESSLETRNIAKGVTQR